jgi:transcriptional regulator with XRE-family HTH domain
LIIFSPWLLFRNKNIVRECEPQVFLCEFFHAAIIANVSTFMGTLCDRIRDCRQARGWRLEDLAKKAGVSKGFLSDLENNKQKNAGVTYLRAIAGALEVSLHFLTTGRMAPPLASEVQLPTSLVDFAKEEQLSINQTMMLLDARRQIVSHRSDGSKSDNLENFDWRSFYQALKPHLR